MHIIETLFDFNKLYMEISKFYLRDFTRFLI